MRLAVIFAKFGATERSTLFATTQGIHDLKRPAKTWGPVDRVGCAMFGWRMEEEAKIQFTITANWQREDGSITTTQLATVDRDGCRAMTCPSFR
jgi:hypothetical protein